MIIYRQTDPGRNMQSMFPTNKMSLLTSFSGFVDHLQLCETRVAIGQIKVSIDKTRSDCLLNMGFAATDFKSGQIINNGTLPSINLFKKLPAIQVFF
jgi:hypothetical protein